MTAEPLVLLPGFMCDARMYWHQVAELSAERSVMVCPLRGESVEAMAQAVLADAPPRFALAGHWLGALVAMEMLKQAPERISRIALMNVSPLTETPTMAGLREQRILRAKIGRLDDAMLEEVPAEALAAGEHRATVQAILLDMAGSLGADRFAAQSRALMRRPDQQRSLRTARLRALLLCGEADTICPPRRHQFLAELIPHGVYKEIPQAGHLAPLEQPKVVTEALRDWLNLPESFK
ncbi:alpha/beta fold hydrolase [Thioclava sp. GXIMD4215]|uniref:alpha/beta fold hydrolase n=1 Tax=Thioclava sp. GXIMD4215 TaxID=3131928 RepID=UPI00325477EF